MTLRRIFTLEPASQNCGSVQPREGLRVWKAVVLCAFLVQLIEDVPASSSNTALVQGRFRPLYGEQLLAARQARDAANVLLEEYKRLHLGPPLTAFRNELKHSEHAYRSEQEAGDFERVVSAFEDIVKKYEGTEIAAYAQLRLCEPYKYRGDARRAINQAKLTAKTFAGTRYEAKAYMTTGNIYLQHLHDPAKAVAWFERIPKPATDSNDGVVRPSEYNEAHVLYLSAQQQMAKCEIKLGKATDAIERYEQLSGHYPQFKAHLDDALRTELDYDLYDRFEVDRTQMLDYVMEPTPFVSEPPPALQGLAKAGTRRSPEDSSVGQTNAKTAIEPNAVVGRALLAQSDTSAEQAARQFPVLATIAIALIAMLVIGLLIFRRFKLTKEVMSPMAKNQ